MDAQHPVSWDAGTWTNRPEAVRLDGTALVVTAAAYSDAWRETGYGFTHASENALLTPFREGAAVEVVFDVQFARQFDQAGVLLRAGDDLWVKAGVEMVDGAPQLGAVVTRGRSDWSVAPVRHWAGQRARVRLSWERGAVTVRAGLDSERLALVRLLPFEASAAAAGPFCCSPTRGGLDVRFHSWTVGPPDIALHGS